MVCVTLKVVQCHRCLNHSYPWRALFKTMWNWCFRQWYTILLLRSELDLLRYPVFRKISLSFIHSITQFKICCWDINFKMKQNLIHLEASPFKKYSLLSLLWKLGSLVWWCPIKRKYYLDWGLPFESTNIKQYEHIFIPMTLESCL